MFLKSFSQNVPVLIENSKFSIKTISNKKELDEVLSLRYDIFYKEFADKKKIIKKDVEKFDFNADHLVIVDKTSNSIVGTYRVICSLFSDNFYSSTEFDIQNVLNKSGIKLELSRACIKEEFRKNVVILFLWRGIVEYIKKVEARYLFGLSSAKVEKDQINELYTYLKNSFSCSEEYKVFPKEKFKLNNIVENIEISDNTKDLVPNLMKFYLKAGSLICGEPAYDKKMNCYDFFTILDREKITKEIESKFF